ncbi:hypothetical protein EYF80_049032 [Liparis tanakae]|uniref:Uncharacterized protein n=1 Tax=Liparis tanakae TaxID=230148 RepID=A0A4Z2FKI6_9TELE|nr:hypothetical protein EYF80_049032 [Liparis tanakae]
MFKSPRTNSTRTSRRAAPDVSVKATGGVRSACEGRPLCPLHLPLHEDSRECCRADCDADATATKAQRGPCRPRACEWVGCDSPVTGSPPGHGAVMTAVSRRRPIGPPLSGDGGRPEEDLMKSQTCDDAVRALLPGRDQ